MKANINPTSILLVGKFVALLLPMAWALTSLTHAQLSMLTDANWESMGTDGPKDVVSAMAFMGNDLYVAGAFPTVQGKVVNGIARWDGRDWFPLGTGV